MVLEVALDFESLPQREAAVQRLDDLATEAVGEHIVAAEGDLADHAGQRETFVRTVPGGGVVVVATPELRVELEHTTARAPPPDLLCGRSNVRRDRNDRADAVREHDRPLEHHHPAHRSAHRGEPRLDAEVIREGRLRADPVADRDHGKARCIRLTVVGMRRRRAGGALASTEHIRAHDEVLVGVEHSPRPDQPAPPAGSGVPLHRRAGGVAVAGQRVTDEHRIAGIGSECAPRLVCERDVAQRTTALEHERAVAGDGDEPAMPDRITRSPRAGGGQHRRMYPAVHPSMMADTSGDLDTY